MSQSAVHKETETGHPESTGGSSPGSRRVLRTLVVTVAVAVVVVAGALIADTVAGMRTESAVSGALLASPRIDNAPEVTLGGFPFFTHRRSGTYPSATITARGVDTDCPAVPGTGRERPCPIELGAALGEFRVDNPGRDAPAIGADSTLHSTSASAYIRLDSVNLGRFLSITDLTVNTPAPEDKAGGGGPGDGLLRRTRGVVLTGTVALPPVRTDRPVPPSASDYDGPTARVSVSADLSVVNGALRITATDFYRGPQDHADNDVPDALRDRVLGAFHITLPALRLPWGITATGATSEGSDILLTGDTGPRDLRLNSF